MTCLLVHGDCDRHRLWLWTCDPKRNVIPKNWNGIQAFVQKIIWHLKVVSTLEATEFYWILKQHSPYLPKCHSLSLQSTSGLNIPW